MVKLLVNNTQFISQVSLNAIKRKFLMQNNKKWMKELKKERSLSIRQSYFKISKLKIRQISRNKKLLRN